MTHLIPDDYFESCVDHLYHQITQNGKGRMAIETAFRKVLSEALEELHSRATDIEYEHPSTMLNDYIRDLDAAIQYYEV